MKIRTNGNLVCGRVLLAFTLGVEFSLCSLTVERRVVNVFLVRIFQCAHNKDALHGNLLITHYPYRKSSFSFSPSLRMTMRH